MLIKRFRREPLGTLQILPTKRLLELAKWIQIPGYEVAQNLLQGDLLRSCGASLSAGILPAVGIALSVRPF